MWIRFLLAPASAESGELKRGGVTDLGELGSVRGRTGPEQRLIHGRDGSNYGAALAYRTRSVWAFNRFYFGAMRPSIQHRTYLRLPNAELLEQPGNDGSQN